MSNIVDLTKGVYRRIFAGFVRGKRICSVSIGAEAWFWRLMMLADDFGNLAAEPVALRNDAQGLRTVNVAKSEEWVKELAATNPPLIRLYRADGDRFIHIERFDELQPAGKNGRRIKRCKGPGEDGASWESGFNQGKPGVPSPSDTEDDNDTEDDTESDLAATRRDAASRPQAPSWTPEAGWLNTDAHRDRWRTTYPACDIDHCLRRMDDWLRANPAKAHKSNWARFISNWLSNEQDKGGASRSGRPVSVSVDAAAVRRANQAAREFPEEIHVPRL